MASILIPGPALLGPRDEDDILLAQLVNQPYTTTMLLLYVDSEASFDRALAAEDRPHIRGIDRLLHGTMLVHFASFAHATGAHYRFLVRSCRRARRAAGTLREGESDLSD